MRKKVDCTPEGATICQTLADRFEPTRHGKGIRSILLMNMKTGAERTLFIYKTDMKDKGVILNYCPWCGGKLHKEYEY